MLALAICSACFAPPPASPDSPEPSSSSDGVGTDEVGASTSEGDDSSTTSVESSTGGTTTSGSSDADTSTTATTGADPGVIGPLFPTDDYDDGAIYPEGDGYFAEWYPSGEENAMGLQYFGEHPTNRQYYGYFRFELPEALPAGASVEAAVLVIHGHDVYAWQPTDAMHVWAQYSADAPAVSGVDHYPGKSIPLAEESMRWPEELGLAWQHPGPNATPDLSPLVQRLIDDFGGLEAGAHLQLWVGEDVLDGELEELGWLDSIAGADTAPSLTITLARPG